MNKIHIALFLGLLLFGSCQKAPQSNLVEDQIAQVENGLLTPLRSSQDSIITYSILERMEFYKVPGVSIAVVKDGEIQWAKGYGIADTESGLKVDTNTLFQAGSISKPVAALAALKLYQDGKLDLDQDVNSYLKGWQIPDSEFTENEKVTVRRLLTHTAGMTVHGFPGYSQTDTFPSDVEVLDGKGNTPKVYVDTVPGSIWRYSGGGYTVMEKVVEDISGQPLEVFLREQILQPIGMTNSTYEQPLGNRWKSNASAAYNRHGEIIEGKWHNYPEQAAAGLWTTPSELANYCIEIQQILAGRENGVLNLSTVQEMLTKHKNDWGLGPSLQHDGENLLFRHGGKNAGFSNEMVAFANQGNAVIIMTNADQGVNLMGELLRSVSKTYGWGISDQQVVKTIDLPVELLQGYLGTYVLNEQVPGIGDYLIEVDILGKTLRVTDPNNGEINYLSAISEFEFKDLTSGDEVTLSQEDDQKSITFNGRFKFFKK